MDMSRLLRLNLSDLKKGLITGVASSIVIGVVVAMAGIVQQPNFDILTVDWASVGHIAVNAGFAAFVGYIGKNLLTDSQGKVLGRL